MVSLYFKDIYLYLAENKLPNTKTAIQKVEMLAEKYPSTRQLQTRINYRPLSRLSMDLKVMPRSYKGQKFILCVIDEVMNYLITVPINQSKSEEIGDLLIENVITKYCIPEYIIMDQDSTFMYSLMNYLFKKVDIK